MSRTSRNCGFLRNTRVYLSGPMDFVASRAEEKQSGWRGRVGEFLRSHGAIVFDPWSKPRVRGLHEYGREDVATVRLREKWSFEPSEEGARARAGCAKAFWETLHIDLRMVDISDFVIALCPTNIYSVGTPHEIILARQQHKPVLFVSTSVAFPALTRLQQHLEGIGDTTGKALLAQLVQEVPIKPNPRGIPSLWYMPLIGGNNFFDGFGFGKYISKYEWAQGPLDERERRYPPARPLLPFLEELNCRLPKRWSTSRRRLVQDEDWLLLDIENQYSRPDR
jgi:hypothetical protein